MQVLEIVRKIIKERKRIDCIELDTRLDSLNFDSLDIVEISLELEDEFHIDFTSEEITSLVTIGDLVKIIERKRK